MNASRKGLVEDCAQMTSDRKYALVRGISTDKRACVQRTITVYRLARKRAYPECK